MARRGNSDLVDVEFDRVRIDDDRYASVLFVVDGRDVWLPRSLIEIDADAATVTCPEWLALQEGLI